MKKKFIMLIFTAAFALGITGCSFLGGGGGGSNNDPPPPPVGVVAPLSVGNAIVWEEITGATGYEVYKSDTLAATVTAGYYVAGELSANAEYKIYTKEGDRKSVASAAVIMYKNMGFADTEVLALEIESDKKYTVAATVNKAVITMAEDLEEAENTYIEILDRTNDLVIELDNVNISAPAGKILYRDL